MCDIFVSVCRSFTLKSANYRLYQFAAGFSTFERVRARKGGLSRDNVLSFGERCWKCSLLNSLPTHIKTKCLYMRCFGPSRSFAAIFIFSIVNSHLVPFLHIIGGAIRANYLFPMICEFHEIYVHSIFQFLCHVDSLNCKSFYLIVRSIFCNYT